MRVGLLTSTRGGSPLLYALGLTLAPEEYEPGQTYDLLLVANQCAHTRNYTYPEFPTDPKQPIAFIDTAEYGTSGTPWNAFAGPVHDTKNAAEQDRLRRFLEGRSFPYFLREMWKGQEYPASYHPIDYPLPRESKCHTLPDRDTYLSRSVPIACIWGHSNAGRVPLTEWVRTVPGADVYVVDGDGPRLLQPEYYRRLEAARCTLSFDGYGSSSFRLPEALVRTALLLGPLRIRQRLPLVDGETCFAYDGNLRARIDDVLADPERAFAVYQAGYEHCMAHYSETATARYILDTAAAHDWSQPTPL